VIVASNLKKLMIAGLAAGSAGLAFAQAPIAAPAAKKPFVAPGTPGSPIDGDMFHAQVLMSAQGFSPGVIDGKAGESFKLALRSFQEARGLQINGKLDPATRSALLGANRPSTVMVKLGPDDVRSGYVMPFPENPEQQAELKFMGYRNMLEKVAERYHTTPATVVALNGPDKLIGQGHSLRLPNVIPTSRDYSGVAGNGASVLSLLNVDGQQPQGDYVVVDKSDGVLKVFRGTPPSGEQKSVSRANASRTDGGSNSAASNGTSELVAAFPVTMGSSKYPLPIGRWKATTYAYLPPFLYQPDLLQNAKTDKEVRLPPGPNGPVGVAWLDLTKEHYGIHGTNEPQTIGRAESSGCIRMTNWDVVRLSRMLKPGFTAIFQG
jgi:lipoprotein-anchoring transpeptidase ErfK/SrfK